MDEAVTLVARSYAKINLGLTIKERLENGYHLIETGFVFINWSDRLEITESAHTAIECNNPEIPTGKSNLITKALYAYNLAAGIKKYYRVSLEKNIPAGAGLGGGSSNAALALLMANKLNNHAVDDNRLKQVAAGIGADVPVFLRAETAVGTGTGTDLEFTNIQPNLWIVTVWPGVHSSTAEAYQGCIPTGDAHEPVKSVLRDFSADDWHYLLHNDLEQSVFQVLEEPGNLKDQMYEAGAVYASMTGSGSAVYGLFDQELTAIEQYKLLLKLGYAANITNPGFRPDHKVYIKG